MKGQNTDEYDIEKILKHFKISKEELTKGSYVAKNKESVRNNTGIILATNNGKIKKAHIIIDYDADFPYVLIRTISL